MEVEKLGWTEIVKGLKPGAKISYGKLSKGGEAQTMKYLAIHGDGIGRKRFW